MIANLVDFMLGNGRTIQININKLPVKIIDYVLKNTHI